jgi:hypothetical protein
MNSFSCVVWAQVRNVTEASSESENGKWKWKWTENGKTSEKMANRELNEIETMKVGSNESENVKEEMDDDGSEKIRASKNECENQDELVSGEGN